MKNKRLSFGIVVVIAMIMLCVLAFGSLCTPKVFASNTISGTNVPLNINAYIDNETFVNSYKGYFNDRYTAPSVALKEDLSILNIIPEELFRKKETVSYLGKKYGFYLEYKAETDLHFAYIFKSSLGFDQDSKLSTRVTPYFYQRYQFEMSTGKVYPEYAVKDGLYEYKRTLVNEKYQLKNVGFSGAIYNSTTANDGQDGYSAQDDNGMFFIGSGIDYSGVGLQGGKNDFINTLIVTALGNLPKSRPNLRPEARSITIGAIIGTAITAVQLINAFANHVNAAQKDFRENISNVGNKGFSIDYANKPAQLTKFSSLFKDAAMLLDSKAADPILFRANDKDFAEGQFFLGTTQQLPSTFLGKCSFEIVKEENVIGGTKVVPFANATTNEYRLDLYEENQVDKNLNINIFDVSINNIYLFNGFNQKLHFIAPENGQYKISTNSTVSKSKLTVNGEVVTSVSNGLASEKIITLKKGDLCVITAELAAGEVVGEFKLIVEYEWKRLTSADTRCNIAADENELFLYEAHQDSYYNFNLSVLSEEDSYLKVSIGNHGQNGYFFEKSTISALNRSLRVVADTKYYVRVTNREVYDAEISIALSPIEALSEGNNNLGVTQYQSATYFVPQKSGSYIFTSNNTSATFELFDEDFQSVVSSVANKYTLTNGQKYCVVANIEGNQSINLQIGVSYDYVVFQYGDQTLQMVEGAADAIFNPKTSGRYDFVFPTSCEVQVVDETGATVTVNDFFSVDKVYYFHFEASTSVNFSVSIKTQTAYTGSLGEDGAVFVKYVAAQTGNHEVVANTDYLVFTNNLLQCDKNFVTGETYYVKLIGSTNQNYSVNIAIRGQNLEAFSNTNATTGYYLFSPIQDNYLFNFYSFSGNTYNVKLLDENFVVLNANLANKSILALVSKDYYIQVTTTSFIMLNIVGQNQAPIVSEALYIGTSITFDVEEGSTHHFTIATSNVYEGEYWFKYAQIKPSQMEVRYYKVGTLEINTCVFSEAGKTILNLSKNTNYRLEILAFNVSGVTNSQIELFIPTKLEEATIDGVAAAIGSLNTKTIKLPMMANFDIVVKSNGGTHSVGIATAGAEMELQNGNKLVWKNGLEGNEFEVIFSDDYQQYYCTIQFVFPFKLEVSYSDYKYTITAVKISESVVAEPVLSDYKTSYEDNINYLIENSTKKGVFDLMNVPLYKNSKDSPNPTFTFSAIINANGSSKTCEVEKEYPIVQETLATVGTSVSREKIVIDCRNLTATKTITFSSAVKSVVVIGNGNTAQTLRMIFNSENVYLYTNNLTTSINTALDGSVIDAPNTNLLWENVGTTKIIGHAKLDVVRCKSLTVKAGASLNILGTKSATYTGINALRCTGLLSIISGTFKTTGGQGRDGSNGSYGRNDYVTPSLNQAKGGEKGGTGESGGNGGHAAIIQSLSITTGADVTFQGGNGGVGGNGGTGGNGGLGDRGIDAGANWSYPQATMGQMGGRGGHGGNGGVGGNGGSAIVVLSGDVAAVQITCNAFLVKTFGGIGGNGGRGGNGGNGGRGGNGGDDHWIWSDSGDCHCGGFASDAGDSGYASRGGFNGVGVANSLTAVSANRGASGAYGQTGMPGARGAIGNAGSAGSPDKCENGQHMPDLFGRSGTVATDYVN